VYEFLEAEFKNKKNMECHFKFIKNARIPVLKMELDTNKGKSSIDLIVNNILGIINSRFLSVYGSVKWVRELSLLIKIWAKNKELIKEETFSSYSFNLILIHYLIQVNKVNLIMDARVRDPYLSPHFTYKRKIRIEYE
jgi:DNA polymerase sigma